MTDIITSAGVGVSTRDGVVGAGGSAEAAVAVAVVLVPVAGGGVATRTLSLKNILSKYAKLSDCLILGVKIL